MFKKNIFLFLSATSVFVCVNLAVNLAVSLAVNLTWVNLTWAKKTNHPIKYISLSVGVYKDIDVLKASKKLSTGGTYKGLLKLQYNSKRKLLRLYPKKTGIGTLFVKNPVSGDVIYEFRIDVKKTSLHKVAKDIQDLLKDIEGIHIKIIHKKVIVDGEILIPADINRIFSVIREYPGQAVSFVTLSSLAQNKISKLIEKAINNPEVHVRAINGKFLLEGVVTSLADKKRAYLLAQTYVPDVVDSTAQGQNAQLKKRGSLVIIDLINVKIPVQPAKKQKLIQLVFHYVELNKDYAKGFSFGWRPSLASGTQIQLGSPGSSSGLTATLSATINNLIPKLNWAKEHGRARVLKSVSIITANGIEGSLNSSSNIPYLSGSGDTIKTSFATAGLHAKVTPTIIDSAADSIQLQVHFKATALTGQNKDGPSISGHEISTTLTVKNGHSAALAGLISNNSGTAYNRLPSNSVKNPIIPLYASKAVNKSQSQFVVFVTPLIKSSASAGVEKIKRKFNLKQ